jgi:hypothetical protein
LKDILFNGDRVQQYVIATGGRLQASGRKPM